MKAGNVDSGTGSEEVVAKDIENILCCAISGFIVSADGDAGVDNGNGGTSFMDGMVWRIDGGGTASRGGSSVMYVLLGQEETAVIAATNW